MVFEGKLETISSRFSKIEPYVFFLFLIANLIPVFSAKLFPTSDGPAHLYNSRIILELIGNPQSFLVEFYKLNSSVNPNWTGHFILSILMTFLPAFIAEKIVLLMYLIGLPLGVRAVLKTLHIKDFYFLYFIFPFTYSFLFFYGFYNFNIGVVLLLFGLNYWLKVRYKDITFKSGSILSIFSFLICFSHLFVFLVYLLAIGSSFWDEINFDRKTILNHVRKLFFLILTLLPSLTIIGFYLLKNNNDNPFVYLENSEILHLIKQISSAKGVNYGRAAVLTIGIFYCFLVLITYSVTNNFIYLLKNKKLNRVTQSWFIFSIIILILLFISPDGKSGHYGFIIQRLLLFFFIFLIIWFSAEKIHLALKLPTFLVIAYLNISFIIHNYSSIRKECILTNELQKIEELIEPNSIVLPVTSSNNFLYHHISNYLGINKPMVILENYEANLYYFPVNWNFETFPKLVMCNTTELSACTKWPVLNNSEKKINYLLEIRDNAENECIEHLLPCLSSSFSIIYENEKNNLVLYKRI